MRSATDRMLFNSAIFVILFGVLYSIYWLAPLRGRQALIIVSSVLFYAWYSIPFLVLFLVIILFNYYMSQALLRTRSRPLLWLTLSIDLGILAFFKYFYMFAEGLGTLIGSDYIASLRTNWRIDHGIEIVLPIAISFYTFQIVAFAVDCYRGTWDKPVSISKYYLFVLFFPHSVAGPIMRATDFIPQIDNPFITKQRMFDGIFLLLSGTLKKVLIADRLGVITGNVWMNPSEYDAVYLILIIPGFFAQIYCDFSGYTDMARGLAFLLGFDIPENFRGPFFSRSMQELWQRWHVTLSTWLRDYIYIPLGGSRLGELRTQMNVMITMAIGGLWHGASWTMVIWGLYLGGILVAERAMRRAGIRLLPEAKWADAVRVFLTFTAFSFSAVFFASPSMHNTVDLLVGIAAFQRGLPISDPGGLVGLIVLALLFNWIQYNPSALSRFRKNERFQYATTFGGVLLTGYLVFAFGGTSGSFIYFKF